MCIHKEINLLHEDFCFAVVQSEVALEPRGREILYLYHDVNILAFFSKYYIVKLDPMQIFVIDCSFTSFHILFLYVQRLQEPFVV